MSKQDGFILPDGSKLGEKKELKLSDSLWVAAEATVEMAKKMGINVSITDVYCDDTVKELAYAATFMKNVIMKVTGKQIEVINT